MHAASHQLDRCTALILSALRLGLFGIAACAFLLLASFLHFDKDSPDQNAFALPMGLRFPAKATESMIFRQESCLPLPRLTRHSALRSAFNNEIVG